MTAPKRTSRPRRLLIGAALFVTVIAAVLLTSPWWWPHVLRGSLDSRGVTFGRFETTGYSRFVLHDVRFANESARASVASVEADSPLVWLLHTFTSQPGPLILDTWQVELLATGNTPADTTPPSIDGLAALHDFLRELTPTLARWLPDARARHGTVLVNEHRATVASADWSAAENRLLLDGLAWRDHTARAELQWFPAADRLHVSAASLRENDWSFTLDQPATSATGELHLWGQTATVTAAFNPSGWLPREAELVASEWTLPASRLQLDAFYLNIDADARVLWRDERFTVALTAISTPAPGRPAPPLRADIAGNGTMDTLTIERFDLSLPGAAARLLAPIVIDADARIRSGESRFALETDLSRLPWPGLSGAVTGSVSIDSARAGEPRLVANLEAVGIKARGFELPHATFEAAQTGSTLTVKNLKASLSENSRLEAGGTWDWSARTLADATLKASLEAAALARWMPEDLTFSKLTIDARADGTWPDLKHSGKFSVAELAAGTPNPVAGEVTWKGTGPAAEEIQLEARSGGSRLTATASASRETAEITAAELNLPDAPTLALRHPARVQWLPAFSIQSLDLSGDATDLSVAFDAPSTRARVALKSVESAWLRDFLPATATERAWHIESLAFDGSWPQGTLTSQLSATGRIEFAPEKTGRIELAARTDATRIQLENLLVSDEHGPVARASGDVPIVIRPTAQPLWSFNPAGSWSLEATTTPDSPFWAAQAEASGIILRSPGLFVNITGPVEKPDARIQLKAQEIVVSRARLPKFSQLDAQLTLDSGRAILDRFTVLAAGQTITASGSTTLPAGPWNEIARNPRSLWSGDAEARLTLPSIDLSAFATFLPAAFAPTGTIDGAITVRASGELDGSIKFSGASTHPISSFGSFSQIQGELVFNGRKASLNSFSALASGQRIDARGSVEFPADAPLNIDLSLAGKNLPLARQTGLLVRGDIDLTVKTAGDGQTTLGGNVNLHDSLFLRDVRLLIPTRGGGPASRPPYFSVEAAPFRDWRLALTVGGERFLNVKTPLFAGVVSGKVDLGGTLLEPIAIGQVVIDEGRVLLPFATFHLRNGAIRLSQANPYSPQLAINAESRAFGYDLRMELSGPASSPALTFSSSPPLASEQVLLMVMAGETPRNEINFSGTDRARRIGTYLGKSLISGLFGGGGGDNAERLTITSGENVTERGKETYTIEYKLTDLWSAVGEYDEFDDYNVGFKRRIFTSKKTNKEAPDDTSR